MENTNYGISPEEEMSSIMKDIEKNIEDEQELDNKSNGQDDNYDGELEEPHDIVDNDVLNEETKLSEEDEPVNEAELFREKYHLEKKKRKSVLADRQRLEQENYRLKADLGGFVESNAELYGRDLYNDLEKIKNIKKQALLGAFGDPSDPEYASKNADILAEADDLYQKASYKVNEYEKYLSKTSESEQEFEPEQNYEEQIKLSKAQEWMDEHPELIEGSYNYNPRLASEFASFVKQADRELKKEGREDEILSDRYLELLEEFVDTVTISRPSDGYTTSKVGGVRNNFSNGGSNTIKVTLTEFDKNYAKNLGISEKEYLKYKIEDIKETRAKSR